MKIAYFTQNPISISETFFTFLVKALDQIEGSPNLIHIVGTSKGKAVVENTLFSGFHVNFQLLRIVYELEERSNLGTTFALKYAQRKATRRLNKLVKLGLPDVAHVEYGTTAVRVYKFLEKYKIPFVVHFHGKDASAEFISPTYSDEIQKVFKQAQFVVTASHHVKRLLVLKGCDPEKIKMIRYGIDVGKFKPISWRERLEKDPSIVFLGRLTEKKNPIALVHAFELVKKEIPNAKLTIIGTGKLAPLLKHRVAQLNLENSVSLLGAMSQADAMEVVNQHWVFAQHNVTSVEGDQEGYALAPAEAACLELPVVTTWHNGIPEHVIDGTTGYLVREFDYETMAVKIIELLNNPNLAESFGTAGRKNIERINNPAKRVESIYGLLQEAYNKANS